MHDHKICLNLIYKICPNFRKMVKEFKIIWFNNQDKKILIISPKQLIIMDL